MGPGLTLTVLGAILVFAVRADPEGIDLKAVGLIFMVAGAGLMAHARHGTAHERQMTRVEDSTDPSQPPQVIRESVTRRKVR